jgi:hypothetical protein
MADDAVDVRDLYVKAHAEWQALYDEVQADKASKQHGGDDRCLTRVDPEVALRASTGP